jgi:tetratricopeptide (TPR) repeat protein
MAFAEDAGAGLHGPRQRSWGQRLDNELDNLRAAVAWSLQSRHPEVAIRIGSAVAVFFGWRRGRPGEVRDWLQAALDLADRLPGRVRAMGYLELAEGLRHLGEMKQARSRCREAVRLYRGVGDARGLAKSLIRVSEMELSSGAPERAAEAATEGLNLARVAGEPWITAYALCAALNAASGLAAAKDFAEEAVAIAREIGDQTLQAMVLSNIGFAALEHSDCEYARTAVAEAVALHRTAVDDAGGYIVSLTNFGLVATVEGRNQEAERALHGVLEACLRPGLLYGVSEVLVAVAALASRASAHARAARLCGAAEALTIESPPRTQHRLCAEATASGRAALGDNRWDQEFAPGRQLGFEDAIGYALIDQDWCDIAT